MEGDPIKAKMVMTATFRCLTVTGLCLAMALGACGRKGDLETPSSTAATPVTSTPVAVTDAIGEAAATTDVVEEPAAPRTFFLDPLIGN